MLQFGCDGQEPQPLVGARDDAVAAQLATEDFDLGFGEPDSRVATSRPDFVKEVQTDVELAEHDL
jgi:hypothetical protein